MRSLNDPLPGGVRGGFNQHYDIAMYNRRLLVADSISCGLRAIT